MSDTILESQHLTTLLNRNPDQIGSTGSMSQPGGRRVGVGDLMALLKKN